MMYQTLKPHWYELCIVYIYLFNFNKNMNKISNNSIGYGFIYNFKDPIHLYNFKSEYFLALQF